MSNHAYHHIRFKSLQSKVGIPSRPIPKSDSHLSQNFRIISRRLILPL